MSPSPALLVSAFSFPRSRLCRATASAPVKSSTRDRRPPLPLFPSGLVTRPFSNASFSFSALQVAQSATFTLEVGPAPLFPLRRRSFFFLVFHSCYTPPAISVRGKRSINRARSKTFFLPRVFFPLSPVPSRSPFIPIWMALADSSF